MLTGSWGTRAASALRLSAACLSTVSAGFLLPACAWGDGPGLSHSSEPYRGPELRVESDRPQHVIVLNAPSGGWSLRLDQVEQELGHREVFISITRPNAAYAHTQAFIEQHLATPVDRTIPLHVYARVLDFGETPSGAYRRIQIDAE